MNTVKERPILFSTPMVRAILDGSKTQTRRIIKPQPKRGPKVLTSSDETVWSEEQGSWHGCRLGKVGDLLWVRETFKVDDGVVFYRATDHEDHAPWKPSIFMFRKYSRINLKITNIRIERLKDISEDDAIAEGVLPNCLNAIFENGKWVVPENNGCAHQTRGGCDTCCTEDGHFIEWLNYPLDADRESPAYSAKESFMSLWVSINGKGSWDENPYVWVIDFEREVLS